MSDAIDERIKQLRENEMMEAEKSTKDTRQFWIYSKMRQQLEELQRNYILVPRSEVPEGLENAREDLQPSIGKNGGDVFRRTGERVYDCSMPSAQKLKQAASLLAEQIEDSNDKT